MRSKRRSDLSRDLRLERPYDVFPDSIQVGEEGHGRRNGSALALPVPPDAPTDLNFYGRFSFEAVRCFAFYSPLGHDIIQAAAATRKKPAEKDQLDPRFIHYAESDRMSRGGSIADSCRAASHRPRLPSAIRTPPCRSLLFPALA